MFLNSRPAMIAYALVLLAIVGSLLMPHLVIEHDIIAHIAAFALLMVWPAFSFQKKRHVVFAALTLVIVGGLAEYLQRYSPERTASLADFMMNLVGIAVGLTLGLLTRLKFRPA